MINPILLTLVGLTAVCCVYADNDKYKVNKVPTTPQFYSGVPQPGLNTVFTETGASSHPGHGVPASVTPQFYSGVPQAGSNVVYTETGKSSAYPGQGVPAASATPQFYSGVPQAGSNVVYTETGKSSSYPGQGVPASGTPQFYSNGIPQQAGSSAVYTETGKSSSYPGQGVPASGTPQFYSASQGASYVAVSSVPQAAAPYVAVSSVPQPTAYVGTAPASSSAHQSSFVAVPSAPQPVPYVAVSTGAQQPTSYVGISPKFNAAPVPAVPAPVTPAVVALPKHASQAQLKSGVADKDAQIISEGREVNHDGTFDFGFNTENGISVQSKGYIKPGASPTDEPIQVIEGSYQYFDGFGKLQTISYIADENGYRAYGDSIPQPHEAILKALAHRR